MAEENLRRTLAEVREILVNGGAKGPETLLAAAKRLKGDVELLGHFLDQVGVPPAATLIDRVRNFYDSCNGVLNAMREWFGEMPSIIDPRENPFLAGYRAGVGSADSWGSEEARRNLCLPKMRFDEWAKTDDAERSERKQETVNEALARIKGEQKRK